MEWRKLFSMRFLVFMLFIVILLPATGFTITTGVSFTVSGIVENVGKDFKFIVVNKAKIFVTSDTKISDENGKYLARGNLKIKLPVSIEVVQKPEGLFAQKVVVKVTR